MMQHENPETNELLLELPDLFVTEPMDEAPRRVVGNRQRRVTQEEITPAVNDGGADDHASCQWQQCCPDWTGPVMKIIDGLAAEHAFEQRIARADYNEQRRLSGIMTTLRARGEFRKLVLLPADWRRQLAQMECDFPNFFEVVEYLRVLCAFNEHRDGVVRFDPILLNGEPGCGKSYFAQSLAEWIGAGSYTVHMETAQSNAILSGSADYWSNSKNGQVFNFLVEKDYANPCFILDEMEKCTSRDYDPLMSLLALFEPGTAHKFHDLSFPWLQIDASAVLWIGTSNDAELLPAPVLDRLKHFDIGMPTADEARGMVRRVFKEMMADLAFDAGVLRLSAPALDDLSELSPRRLKRVLREAIGRALYERRRTVLARDIAMEVEADMPERPPMGFV